MSEALKSYVEGLAKDAKAASSIMAALSSQQKNIALRYIQRGLEQQRCHLISENDKDIQAAMLKGCDAALIDRLKLSDAGIDQMIVGLEHIISLADPIGEMFDIKPMPSGIQVGRMRVPLGVIGIIYEARPNVTIDATALCLKSGNAVILRGGSDAFYTNQALAEIIETALSQAGLPMHCVQVMKTTARDAVGHLLQLNQYIDIIIPRGGNALVARINAESKIPVIKHLSGVCHTFIDQAADVEMAVAICDNAKTQRYAPCNTMETLLIDAHIASIFLPKIAQIYASKQVEMRVCEQAGLILKAANIIFHLATEDDWHAEYLAPIIAIKIVADMQEAIWHINHYGSHHTDVIVTNHHPRALQFLARVDSASVMINASSRFTDGFEFGLGAEIGISTDKLHARGPVGLEGLTSVKYIVFGHGEIRV